MNLLIFMEFVVYKYINTNVAYCRNTFGKNFCYEIQHTTAKYGLHIISTYFSFK